MKIQNSTIGRPPSVARPPSPQNQEPQGPVDRVTRFSDSTKLWTGTSIAAAGGTLSALGGFTRSPLTMALGVLLNTAGTWMACERTVESGEFDAPTAVAVSFGVVGGIVGAAAACSHFA